MPVRVSSTAHVPAPPVAEPSSVQLAGAYSSCRALARIVYSLMFCAAPRSICQICGTPALDCQSVCLSRSPTCHAAKPDAFDDVLMVIPPDVPLAKTGMELTKPGSNVYSIQPSCEALPSQYVSMSPSKARHAS